MNSRQEAAEDRRADTGAAFPSRPLDLIACDTCGRCFATHDGPGMMAAIEGPCPDCGGRFQLADGPPENHLL